jgi:polysaccharide pyruvyl transferase WcaK-like protein
LRTARPNVLACDTVAEVLRSLATVDLAVTSRLHATVLAHRCGCPVVAISFERKVNADMEHFGHADYVLDIFTFELDMLQQKYLALAANADPLRRQLTQDVRAANDAIQRQNALILGLARR